MSTILTRAIAQRARPWLESPAAPPPDLIDLSGDALAGSISEPVRSAAIEAIRGHRCDHYTRRPGIAPLCRAVAEALARSGVTIDPDNGVVITGGAREARFVALRALAPGKRVYLPRLAPPYYQPALEFARADVIRFDPEGELPEASSGVLVLPNPNPATGQLYPADLLARLATWAAASDLTVVADETHAPLVRPDLQYQSFAALEGMAARTLTLGSFAHQPGLNAWQVAFFAGPAPLVTTVRDLKQAMTICSPAPGQYAALVVADPRNGEAVLGNIERIEALASLLDRLEIPYLTPHTVAYVIADVTKLGGGDDVADACAAHGVAVAAGRTFGDSGAIRITATGDRFAEGLSRLETALKSLKGRAAS